MAITPAQVRAGRLLIGWSQLKLASETGVSAATIAIFEDGEQQPAMLDMAVVERMLNDGGVEFIDKSPGVRVKAARRSTAGAVARQGAAASKKSVGRG
jgi:transcriptional regulator with XRE-family HTH domain